MANEAGSEAFVMTPEEITQCMSSDVLKPFIKDNDVDRKAVESFIMSGDRDLIPEIVAAMPVRVRAHMKKVLSETRGVKLFRNGRLLLEQL